MKNLILTLIITLPLTLWGQGWEQTYGGDGEDYGHSVQQTNDGGYIITGGTSNVDEQMYVYLLKTDGNGNEIWSKTFGFGVGNSVQQTQDGGYIIYGYGYLGSVEVLSFFLLKTDENGNEIWNNTFGVLDPNSYQNDGQLGESVQQTQDGGYIITGTFSDGDDSSSIYLIKTDGSGNEIWSKTFGETGYDWGFSVQQTNDGGFIISGSTYDSDDDGLDVWLIKTDESGNEIWNNTFGGLGLNYGFSVKQTQDEGYIITGTTTSTSTGNIDVYLIKTDGSGNEVWNNTFGGDDNKDDLGHSVQQTNDEGYIIIGTKFNPDNVEVEFSVYLIKTDGSGNEIWSNTFGFGWGYSGQQTNDGGFIITGNSYSLVDDQTDVYLIKTDGNGNITSTFEIPLPNPNRKLEKTVNLKGQEIKPQTNTPIIEIFDDGSVEKKIIIE